MSRIQSKLGDRSYDVVKPATSVPRSTISHPVILTSRRDDNNSMITSSTYKLDQYITPSDKDTDFSDKSYSHVDANQSTLKFESTSSVSLIKELNGSQTSVATIPVEDVSRSETIYPNTTAPLITVYNTSSKKTFQFSDLDVLGPSDKEKSNESNSNVFTNVSSSNNRLGVVDKGWSRKSTNYSLDIDSVWRQLESGNAISTGHPDVGDGGLHVGTHVTGLISGEIIAISIGCILAFWLIVGPIVYVLIRLRDGKSSRKRVVPRDDEMSPTLLEEIIRVELAKGRAKLYRTSIEDNRELEKFAMDDCGSRRDGRFEIKFATTHDLAGAAHEGINACHGFPDSPLNDSLRRVMLPAVRNGIRTLDKVLVRNSFNLSTRTPENVRKLLREATSNYNNSAFVGSHSRSANLSSDDQQGIQTLKTAANTSAACFWNAAQSLYSPTADESRFTGSSFSSQHMSSTRIAQSPDFDIYQRHVATGSNDSPQMDINCDGIGTMSRHRYNRWDTPLNTSVSTGHFQNESTRDTTSLCRTLTGSLQKGQNGRLRSSLPQSSTLGSICEKTPRKFPVMGCRQNSLMQGRESRDASPTGHMTNSPVISEMFCGKRSHSDASVRRSRPTHVASSPYSPSYPLSPTGNNSTRMLVSPTERCPFPSSTSEQTRFKVNETNKSHFVISQIQSNKCTISSENGYCPPLLLKNSPVETLWKYNHCLNNSIHSPVGQIAHRSVELVDSTV